MRTMMTLGLLVTMVSVSFAQDPNRNRMNEQAPAKLEERAAVPGKLSGLPSAYGNRMNVEYGPRMAVELTGGPNPNENRMNYQVPKAKAKAQPKPVEQAPIDPAPTP